MTRKIAVPYNDIDKLTELRILLDYYRRLPHPYLSKIYSTELVGNNPNITVEEGTYIPRIVN